MADNLPVFYISDIDISCIELELNKYLFNCTYLCIRLGCHKISLLFLCTDCLM